MVCFTPRLYFSSRRRHTMLVSDWSSDVCSSDLDQVIVIYAATTGVLDEIDLAKVKSAEKRLINFVYEQAPELKPKLAAFSAETESRLKELMQKFKESI